MLKYLKALCTKSTETLKTLETTKPPETTKSPETVAENSDRVCPLIVFAGEMLTVYDPEQGRAEFTFLINLSCCFPKGAFDTLTTRYKVISFTLDNVVLSDIDGKTRLGIEGVDYILDKIPAVGSST